MWAQPGREGNSANRAPAALLTFCEDSLAGRYYNRIHRLYAKNEGVMRVKHVCGKTKFVAAVLLAPFLLMFAITAVVGAASSAASSSSVIIKDYRWVDRYGSQWSWQLPISQYMYTYYKNRPRLHEQIVKQYEEKFNELKKQEQDIVRLMDYWYNQYQIRPGDSKAVALKKYKAYAESYYKAQNNLAQIRTRYLQLLNLYQQAQYEQMLNGYVPYVTEKNNSSLTARLAKQLSCKTFATDKDRIEFAAAFVQRAIPYVAEEGEYPKYAVETLVEGGDCEDKSIILAGILKAMGYRTALLVFDGNPGHMAVGVECPGAWGSYFPKNGVKYFYLETTESGWQVGQIPPEYQGRQALVYAVN